MIDRVGGTLRDIEQIHPRLQSLGAGPGHQTHVLRRGLQAQLQDSGRRRIEHFLPLALRKELPTLVDDLANLARLRSQHPGADGSALLWVELGDGQTVQSVLPRTPRIDPGGTGGSWRVPAEALEIHR